MVHTNEIKNVLVCALILTLLSTGESMGWIIQQTLMVKRLGLESIPYTYILFIIGSLTSSWLYIKFHYKVQNNTLFFFSTLLLSLMLFLSRFLIGSHALLKPQFSWDLAFFFIISIFTVAATTTVLYSTMWNLVYHLFRPIQLQRLMPFFSICPIIGGILSGLLVNTTVAKIGAANLVLIWGALLLISSVLLYVFYLRSMPHFYWEEQGQKKPTTDFVESLKNIRSIVNLKNIAVVLLLISCLKAICSQFTKYQFIAVSDLSFANEVSMAAFFSQMEIAIYGSILLYFILVREKALQFLGVFPSLFIVPLVSLSGFAVLTAHFGFWEMFVFRFAFSFFYYAFFNPAWQISFAVLPGEERGRTRALADLLNYIGIGLAGLILIFIKNLLVISILGLIFSAIWLWLNREGARVYLATLLKNLSRKDLLFDTLESIEDNENFEINEKLKSILRDKENFYSVADKIKVLQTIQRMGNPEFLRMLALSLKKANFELKIGIINVINTLFHLEIGNQFLKRAIFNKMTDILNYDTNELVQAEAAKFLFENSPKEQLLDLFTNVLRQNKNENTRLVAYKSLSKVSYRYSDILQAEGLMDESPAIRGEMAVSLWRFSDYREEIKDTLMQLLHGNEESIYHGLKALVQLDNLPEFIPEAEKYAYHENKDIRILASLFILKNLDGKNIKREALTENIIAALVGHDIASDEVWKRFVAMLVKLENDGIADEIISRLTEQASLHPIVLQGLRHLAGIMYQSMPYKMQDDIKF